MTLFRRSLDHTDRMRSRGSPRLELDEFQKNILLKASALSNTVKEVTIGPHGSLSAESNTPRTHRPQLNASRALKDTRTPPQDKSHLKVTPSRMPSLMYTSEAGAGAIDTSVRTRMKLMHELELLRQQDIKDKIKLRLDKMREVERAHREEMLHHQEIVQRENQARVLKEEQNILQQLHEEELRSSQRQEQMASAHKQHAKRVHELSQMITEAEQRQREAEEEERRRLLEKKIQLDKIHKFQIDYRVKYQKIHDVTKICKDRQALTAVHASNATKIKSLNEAMDQLVEQCKVGEVSNLDLQTAAAIVQQMDEVANYIQGEVVKINEHHDKAVIESQEAAKREEQAAANAEAANQVAVGSNSSSSAPSTPAETNPHLNAFVDKEAVRVYVALQQYSQEFQKTYADLLKDDRMKKFRFECQKAVNIPVNTISAVSASHMADKLSKLSRLLSGQTVELAQGHLSASAHPQGIAFCKDLVAKKFVEQGELAVSSKPEAAFAFAAVAVALWADFPDFGQLLLGHFYKECPYLVPIFMPQLEGQTNQEYYKSLGYIYTESGEVEKQDKFLKRMSGIMRLYAAILITQPRRSQNKPHPHGVKQTWRWLACMLNTDPQPDICASLLFDFLEVTGNAMFTYYGFQFQKLLHLICKEYFPRIEKVTASSSRGPVARLELFLQTIIKQGRIPPPEGYLPANFW